MNPLPAAPRPAARLALAAALLLVGAVQAKTGDSEQAINVTAQRSEIDNKTGTVIYSGAVTITQGSLNLKAARVTLYRNAENELDRLVAEGEPAVYHQLTDQGEPVEGRAKRIEYHTATEVVVFLSEVKLTQAGGNTTEAERVEYHSAKNTAQATAAEGGVVTTVIQPRKKKPEEAKPQP
ncbi:MAG: lipopolysaccharide transport periplasmic protein LptA [Gammaproteobacteria bacterium]|nr:lipopolysaccharide transport periplasmic protein LptA [Gammaproteobacteria bacterium]